MWSHFWAVVRTTVKTYGFPEDLFFCIFFVVWAGFDGSIDFYSGMQVIVPVPCEGEVAGNSIRDLFSYFCTEVLGVNHGKPQQKTSEIVGGKDILYMSLGNKAMRQAAQVLYPMLIAQKLDDCIPVKKLKYLEEMAKEGNEVSVNLFLCLIY
jgi:hypothetical protein